MIEQSKSKLVTGAITSFTGEYEFLSNFYISPIVFADLLYKSPEHAYQSAKAACDADREKIRNADTPRQARTFGATIEIRHDWDEVRVSVMHDILRSKFFMRPDLLQKLKDTHTRDLVEGNSWGDRFWGAELENGEWIGENNLGKLLMKIRGLTLAELRKA